MKKALGILVGALVFPVLLFAQEDALRAQIRADIMQDPRSSQMSQAEQDALVEQLAAQAEADGTSSDYLESKNTFDTASLFTPPAEPSAVTRVLLSPLGLAVAFLALVLCAVVYYIIHRGRRPHAADLE
jgi:hypothetical protein